MKKYSKLKLFYQLGFLQRKFDGNEFKDSILCRLKSYLVLLFALLTPIKFSMGIFFAQDDKIQLYIGNLYNYLDYKSRIVIFFIGKLLH